MPYPYLTSGNPRAWDRGAGHFPTGCAKSEARPADPPRDMLALAGKADYERRLASLGYRALPDLAERNIPTMTAFFADLRPLAADIL
jgi:hypothetical protein